VSQWVSGRLRGSDVVPSQLDDGGELRRARLEAASGQHVAEPQAVQLGQEGQEWLEALLDAGESGVVQRPAQQPVEAPAQRVGERDGFVLVVRPRTEEPHSPHERVHISQHVVHHWPADRPHGGVHPAEECRDVEGRRIPSRTGRRHLRLTSRLAHRRRPGAGH
jgi:hypothetical protein